MRKVLIIAIILTLAGLGIFMSEPAECNWCLDTPCYAQSDCDMNCVCGIPNGEVEGKCMSGGW